MTFPRPCSSMRVPDPMKSQPSCHTHCGLEQKSLTPPGRQNWTEGTLCPQAEPRSSAWGWGWRLTVTLEALRGRPPMEGTGCRLCPSAQLCPSFCVPGQQAGRDRHHTSVHVRAQTRATSGFWKALAASGPGGRGRLHGAGSCGVHLCFPRALHPVLGQAHVPLRGASLPWRASLSSRQEARSKRKAG